ncbi:MAG: helix-turn-helix domain-containing protein [Promethearchaeota archaeon]
MTMSPETLWNVKKVADFLQVNVTTIYAWAQRGRIPAIKLGRNWRFRPSDLEAWLNRNRRDLAESVPSTLSDRQSDRASDDAGRSL